MRLTAYPPRRRQLVEHRRLEGIVAPEVAWLRGTPASALLGNPRLTVDAALLLVSDCCRALADAHERVGLVHRGLSLANVVVDRRGGVQVVGLGGALPRRGSCPDADALAAALVGKPPDHDVGMRWSPTVDVYAAGVMLLELLYGGPVGNVSLGDQAQEARVGSPVSSRHRRGLELAVRFAVVRHGELITPQVRRAVKRMVAYSSELRPSMASAAQELQGMVRDPSSARRALGQAVRELERPAPRRAVPDAVAVAVASLAALFVVAGHVAWLG